MSLLVELLTRVGLGGGAVAAATCVVVAFYLLRARSVGARAASAGAAVVAYSVAILVVLAVALGLGWFDAYPGVIIDHVRTGLEVVVDRATAPGRRFVRWLVDVLLTVAAE